MGLDMYLYAEKCVEQYDYDFKNNKRTDNPEFDRANELVKGMPTAEFGDIVITKTIGYWRKANAVHGWIVRNCAQGVDECQRIDMDREDLVALRQACLIGLQDRDNAIPDENEIHIDGSSGNSAEAVADIIQAIKRESQNSNTSIEAVIDPNNPIPPIGGFFFGSTAKDEYYYHQLANTVETINSILASDPDDTYRYYYRASW